MARSRHALHAALEVVHFNESKSQIETLNEWVKRANECNERADLNESLKRVSLLNMKFLKETLKQT